MEPRSATSLALFYLQEWGNVPRSGKRAVREIDTALPADSLGREGRFDSPFSARLAVTDHFRIYYTTNEEILNGQMEPGFSYGDAVSDEDGEAWCLQIDNEFCDSVGRNLPPFQNHPAATGNGRSDFVDKVEYALERAWTQYSSRSSLSGWTPDAPVEIRLENTSFGSWANPLNDVIHIDIDAEQPLHLSRHELFHIFQYQFTGTFDLGGPDFDKNIWWIEASAEWAANSAPDLTPVSGGEDIYENDAADDRVDEYLAEPGRWLMDHEGTFATAGVGDNNAYNSWLFVEFLSRRFDEALVSEVLQLIDSDFGADLALETVLAQRGSSLSGEVEIFAIANYLLATVTDLQGAHNEPVYYDGDDVALWRSNLDDVPTAPTGQDEIGEARPFRHTAVVSESGSVSGTAVVQPGGTAYVDVRLAADLTWNRAGVRIEVDELDGVSAGDYAVSLLQFENSYPAMCGVRRTGANHEIVLSGGCPVATLVLTHTKPQANESQDAEFAWTAQVTQSPYALDVLEDNPSGYWRLGEATTLDVVKDASGNSRHGTFGGGVSLLKQGAIKKDPNTAARFSNVTNAGVRVTNDPFGGVGIDEFTVEGWARTTASNTATDVKSIVARDGMFNLGRQGNKAYGSIRVGTTTFEVKGSRDINEGKWHHFALTYDGADLKLYVDGEQVDEEAAGGTIQPSAADLRFGASCWCTSSHFTGDIDEVAVYDHVLEELRFQERFEHQWTPLPNCPDASAYADLVCESEPIGYWRLGEPGGSTAMADHTEIRNGVYPGGMTLGRWGAISGDSNKAAGISSYSPSVAYEQYGSYAVDEFSAEGWVRTTENKASSPDVSTIIGRADSFNLGLQQNKAYGSVTIGGLKTEVKGGLAINDGTWHHLALTYDGTSLRLFVDGVEVLPAVSVTGRPDNVVDRALYVGSMNSSATRLRGEVDEAAFYDRALESDEIQARQEFTIPPVRLGPSTWEEGSGSFNCDGGGQAKLADPDLYVIDGGLLHFDVAKLCPSSNQGVDVNVYTINADGSRGVRLGTFSKHWALLPAHFESDLGYADLHQPLWVEFIGSGSCCSTRMYGIAKTNLP